MKLFYFAWVREKTGIGQEDVSVPDSITTISELMEWLKTRGPEFESAFAQSDVIRAAIDQSHVKHSAQIKDADEIAFFPPVTGG